MNGPLDEIGQTLAKGDTVVLCFDGQHYAAQVVDIKEPSLITSASAVGPGRAAGAAAGMGMPGVVTLAIMPMSIMFTAQAPKVKCLKIQPPKPPGGQA